MSGRWIGAAFGLAVGAVAGWLWGVSIAQSMRNSGGPLGPEFPATVGLIGVGLAVIVLLVIAGLTARAARRRGLATSIVAAAVGLVGAYFVKLAVGCSTASCVP